MRHYKVGDIVMIKGKSGEITGYIYNTATITRKTTNHKVISRTNYIYIVSENGECIALSREEAETDLIFITESKYLYNYNHPDYEHKQAITLKGWIDSGVFYQVINAYGYRFEELDKSLSNRVDSSFWKLID